ncbi:MAG: beta-propeller fold lactonase family protein [Xanthomonadales bacterium]|nr:beta-propeller fold lactonase family protein [Xanthomonadales bacterium]
MLKLLIAVTLALACVPTFVDAKIKAPDHVIYGTATVFGAPATNGTVIELRSYPEDVLLTRYVLGRDPSLGNQFALRIPMDTVEPREAGHARPGDAVHIFLGTRIAAETTVGEEGVAVRLDLDPQNMGTGPGISVALTQALEGNVGVSPMVFTMTLNNPSTESVSATWQTQDGTAIGAATCAAGVDYVSDQGVATVAAGAQTQAITISLCGDAVVETNETLSLLLTGATGGVLQNNVAVGTLIDDDDVPEVIIDDARALEPSSGMVDLVFHVRLSRPSAIATSFNYATQNLSAIAGPDYLARSGTVAITAGQTLAEIRVPVLADATIEPREQFRLVLSSPLALRFGRNEAFGDIVDPAYDPAVFPVEETTGPAGILAAPSDVVLSPDGLHAYVASESLDTIVAYSRDVTTGRLTRIAHYTDQSAGFAGALLDGPSDLVVSGDGAQIYVASRNAGAVAVLARNASDGTLSYVQSRSATSLQGASALHLSADGQHLYVAGGTANTVVSFTRTPGTGDLTQLEVETNAVNDPDDSGGAVTALDRPSGVTTSADGAQLYVASRFGNAVLTFNRTNAAGAGFGKLSFASVQRNGLAGVQGLGGAYDLVLSPDNGQLYVVGESSNAIAVFDRAANGALTWRTQIRKNDPGVHGLGGPQSVEVSPDGTQVYVAGFADDSFTVFSRATVASTGVAVGDLRVQQTVFDDEGQVSLLNGPVAIASSADNRHIYVAASVDNSVVVFTRDSNAQDLFKDGFE